MKRLPFSFSSYKRLFIFLKWNETELVVIVLIDCHLNVIDWCFDLHLLWEKVFELFFFFFLICFGFLRSKWATLPKSDREFVKKGNVRNFFFESWKWFFDKQNLCSNRIFGLNIFRIWETNGCFLNFSKKISNNEKSLKIVDQWLGVCKSSGGHLLYRKQRLTHIAATP